MYWRMKSNCTTTLDQFHKQKIQKRLKIYISVAKIQPKENICTDLVQITISTTKTKKTKKNHEGFQLSKKHLQMEVVYKNV